MKSQNDKTASTMLSPSQVEFIRNVTGLFQQLGLPRTIGEIYGLVYVSCEKLSLDEIAEILSISKGSVSHGVRKLKSLQAINQVYVSGSRKDYFEVRSDLGNVVKDYFEIFIRPKINKSKEKLSSILKQLDEDLSNDLIESEHYNVLKNRFEKLKKFESKINTIIPIARKLL